jgi:hypothetical protein
MNKKFYFIFAAQTFLLLASLSTTGLASAQNITEETGLAQNPAGDIPTTQAVGNLTNATSNPEDIKQMNVIGGTVNATLNQSSSGGMMSNQSGMMSNQSGMMSNQSGMMSNQSGMMSNQSGMMSNQPSGEEYNK